MVAVAFSSKFRQGLKARGRKTALFGAAAATAVAMTMGSVAAPVAPTANAALTLDTTTTGPLLWLVNQLGVDSFTFDNVPVVGSITLAFDYNRADPVGLYNDLNAATFGGFVLGTATRPNVLASSPTGPLLVASGTGVPAALQTYQALLASANGNTPAGFTPLTAAGKVNSITGQPCSSGITCVQGTYVTNLPMALVRNPETPNGGLYARFAPIFNLFGQNPVSPNAGSGSSLGIKLNGAFVNVALGYDMLSDFPETLNPFSLANSFMATVLPTYLLGGAELKGTSLNTIEGNLIALLTLGAPSTSYSTLVSTDLPLLEPLRLPSRILNAVFKQVGIPITLGTPLADALQPALEILVNTGYTDVQTPSEGGTYNRTYDQSGQYIPFLSQATLTPQEWAAVPGDVVKALITGFRDVLSGKSTATPDPVTGPSDPPVEPAAAQTVSTAMPSSAKSGKPSKKLSSTASKKSSAPKASAKKGVGGSKRAAS
ncbi:PE-PPE domain-containing protein [Mycolicibacterium sphagni]|uniref:PE-PPE domain-containing protein n=1 Tax=Mycolicibacterium sphagni TaxID=1786 RepID=A0ABX2JUM1_9MYCO|nr:PE-PPE domain-containing protein [Mycolicibacterium sphagni]NTY61404.1 PE-PPE domain-containing protein [Mycolicibacterium sphagni]